MRAGSLSESSSCEGPGAGLTRRPRLSSCHRGLGGGRSACSMRFGSGTCPSSSLHSDRSPGGPQTHSRQQQAPADRPHSPTDERTAWLAAVRGRSKGGCPSSKAGPIWAYCEHSARQNIVINCAGTSQGVQRAPGRVQLVGREAEAGGHHGVGAQVGAQVEGRGHHRGARLPARQQQRAIHAACQLQQLSIELAGLHTAAQLRSWGSTGIG